MQSINCGNFKDWLDSSPSDELAVETHQAWLHHAEQCAACRIELTARHRLRDQLRRIGQRTVMPAESRARVLARVREEAARSNQTEGRIAATWRRLVDHCAAAPLPIGLTATATLLVVALGLFYLVRPQAASALSAALVAEAVGDHTHCAVQFLQANHRITLPENARSYDPSYAELDRIAEAGAQDLKLHSAHLCAFAGRKFAHLVYTRQDELISLLITERDGRAVQAGATLGDDGLRAGLQRALHEPYQVGSYQTAKHVVLVVSKLSARENGELAERLALPVSRHLRQIEAQTTAQPAAK